MKTNPFAVVLAVAAGACGPEAIELDYSCRTTRDCPLGEVCNVPTAECIPEPTDGLMGSFACRPVPIGSDPDEALPGSDIIGSLGPEQRYVLPVGAYCIDLEGVAMVTALTPDRSALLIVTVGASLAGRGGQHAIVPATAQRAPSFSASLQSTGDDPRMVAYSTGGSITLDGPLELGELGRGFLDLEMAATETGDFWGADCTDQGAAACGDSLQAECDDTASGNGRYCTAPCAADTDCTTACGTDEDCPGSALCSADGVCGRPALCHGGFCRLPCSADADCPETLSCGDAAGVGGCR